MQAKHSWKKLEEREYRAGHRKMINRTFELPDGKIDDYDLVNPNHTVCVLALTKDRKVVLASQYRPAQERILLELPGGGIEEGETPEEAVKREFLEETGYSGKFEFVAKSLESAYNTLVRYNFVALECEKVQESEPDTNEHIEVVEMDLRDFREHLKSGELTDVATGYPGLDYLNLL
jgi:ADP-ribose pyrophosphatase